MKALTAKFETPEAAAGAIDRLREAGHDRLDAFMPYPVDAIIDRIGPPTSRVGWTAALAALAGGALTATMIYWSAAVDYPLNVGGRPLASWPAFAPPILVAAALWSGIATLIALLYWCGLPRWHNPLFDIAQFDRASWDRFFVAVHGENAEQARALLGECGAERIDEVAL